MVNTNVQYINDADGNPIGVFVPIEEYRRVFEDFYSADELKADLIESIRWAKNTPVEEKEELDVDALINELEDLSRATFSEVGQKVN